MTDNEINEAVARKLGYKLAKIPAFNNETVIDLGRNSGFADFEIKKLPVYCHSIEAAWEILEKFDYAHSHNIIARSPSSNGWHCQLNDGLNYATASEYTAQMAICLAFLKL